ncbi:MAG: ComF family protein [Limnohabitans sp.]
MSSPPAWQACASAVAYTEPWRSLIIRFKFHEQPALARFFAKIMMSCSTVHELVLHCDYLIPVPLSVQRLRQRGFNQSLLLARHLSPQRCLDQGLLRLRDTPAQAGLSREMRLANLTHAFAVHPKHIPYLTGKKLLLVDDVLTTGSTLQACSLALLQAGASRVDGVILARAQSQTNMLDM